MEHFWCTDHHRQTRTQKTHHDPDLGEATTFPLIVYSMHGHRINTQMSFCPQTPKWKFRNSQSWNSYDFGGLITLCENLWLRWGLKKSCSPCWDLSNSMWQPTWTQQNWGDSWLLVVRSQFVNLTFGPSFGHNLWFKCPNGHAISF